MTSVLYSAVVNKPNPPNTIESVQPLSGDYSCKKDIKLNSWLAVATAIYVLDLFLSRRHPEWSVSMRAMFALAPLVPGLLYMRSCMRFIGGLDELQRRIQLEAWLFAVMGTVVIATAISTLNASGVHMSRMEHGLGMEGAFITTFLLWIVGSAVANRRYK